MAAMNAKILGTIVFVLIPSLALAQPAVRRSPVSINRVLDRVIDMPVKKVTSVMLGGPNLDVLYVTSTAKPPLPRAFWATAPCAAAASLPSTIFASAAFPSRASPVDSSASPIGVTSI
jgi:hypothetical protein